VTVSTPQARQEPPTSIGAPLDPDSVTWRHFGDSRQQLFFIRTGGWLQALHPAVGWMLQEHSDTFSDPWNRIFRSQPLIQAVIYDEPVEAVFGPTEAERVSTARGRKVRDFHKGLNVTDDQGRSWHALQPDVYYWTHATFVETIVASQELFGTPLTPAEKDQLIAESITWWRRYGMADIEGMPTDWASFETYWNRMLDEVLERNPTSDFPGDSRHLKIAAPPGVPRLLWKIMRPAVNTGYYWLSVGITPPRARELQGLDWGRRDEELLRIIRFAIKHTWPLLPETLRYQPQAVQARRRKRLADKRRARPTTAPSTAA